MHVPREEVHNPRARKTQKNLGTRRPGEAWLLFHEMLSWMELLESRDVMKPTQSQLQIDCVTLVMILKQHGTV